MKKIVFLDQCLGAGGAERVMCTVIRSLDPAKFEIHLVLVSKVGDLLHLIPDYIKIHILGVPKTSKALFPLIRILWRIRPNLVFATLSRTVVLALIARLFCPRFQVLARYSSMPMNDINSKSLGGWKLWLTKKLYRNADAVIAQTLEMEQQLVNCFQIPSKKIHTIKNPVDVSYIKQSLNGYTNPFPKDSINILASGTIYPVKGYDILLNALKMVLDANPNFKLYILGKDFQGNKNKLTIKASKLGIRENVCFCGFKENPYPYYKFCDLYVLSSRSEGLPNVLLECLYLGKPVVATRCVPVIDRLIEHGKTGFLVEVENFEQIANAILNYKELTGKPEEEFENEIALLIEKLASERGG